MKIILKYILVNVKDKKMRSAVMLMSILLSTALLFVSFSIGTSYESAQRKMAQGMAGAATVAITAKGDKNNIKINDVPDLSSIEACVGILESSSLYHENGYYETVDLLAADLIQLNQINKPRLLDGGDITDFTGKKIILPERFTSKYGIEQGDFITLQINASPVSFKVEKIAAYDTVFLRHTRGATALLPLSALKELLGQTDGYSKILVKPQKDVSTGDLLKELKSTIPSSSYKVSEIVNEAQVIADARQKSMPFFLISFFSFTISVFIIYSSYKVIILDRLPVIATFRSIGATQKAVTHILLLESLFYGSVGGVSGVLVGMFVLKLILQGMGNSLAQGIEIPVIISLFSIMISFAVAIAASMLSALLPIRRASRLPIKEVVLGTVEEKKISKQFIFGLGFVLFLVSVVLPRIASDNLLYLAGGFSLLGLITATILIIPPITNLTSMGLERLYGLILKNEGKLAARNIRDNRSIAQNITLLFISISAVIAISVVGNFVTVYISDVFNQAQLQGFADGQMDTDFIEQVKQMDGIEKVLPLFVYKNEMRANGMAISRLEATDNLQWYSSMFALNYKENSELEQVFSMFEKERSIILSESCIKRTGVFIGDTLSLSNGVVTNSYVVIGSFKSRATDVEAIISSTFAIFDFSKEMYGFLAFTAANPDAIMVQIRHLFGDTSNWSRTVEEFNKDAMSTVGAFLRPMHNMTYFIFVLATVGVINNLLINYIQKRRSIAMYKSVGLSNWQNFKITLIEGISCGLIGMVIAVVVSYMEIQTIFLVAGPKISMVAKFGVKTFFLAGAMGLLVTLLGSVVPILKSRQMKIIEEIKFD